MKLTYSRLIILYLTALISATNVTNLGYYLMVNTFRKTIEPWVNIERKVLLNNGTKVTLARTSLLENGTNNIVITQSFDETVNLLNLAGFSYIDLEDYCVAYQELLGWQISKYRQRGITRRIELNSYTVRCANGNTIDTHDLGFAVSKNHLRCHIKSREFSAKDHLRGFFALVLLSASWPVNLRCVTRKHINKY